MSSSAIEPVSRSWEASGVDDGGRSRSGGGLPVGREGHLTPQGLRNDVVAVDEHELDELRHRCGLDGCEFTRIGGGSGRFGDLDVESGGRARVGQGLGERIGRGRRRVLVPRRVPLVRLAVAGFLHERDDRGDVAAGDVGPLPA